MRKRLAIFIIMAVIGTAAYGLGYEEEIKTGKEIESMGKYKYGEEDCLGDCLFAFKHNGEIYTIDSIEEGGLISFGIASYSYGKDIFSVEVYGSPSGHNTHIYVLKKSDTGIKLLGTIETSTADLTQMKTVEENEGNWKLKDYDNDGKYEIMIYLGNFMLGWYEEFGYVFVEVTDNGLKIDYNVKNYLSIKKQIKNKKEYKTNMDFINGKIDKKKLEKRLIIEDSGKYKLDKRLRVENIEPKKIGK